jgi:hypothetical protein
MTNVRGLSLGRWQCRAQKHTSLYAMLILAAKFGVYTCDSLRALVQGAAAPMFPFEDEDDDLAHDDYGLELRQGEFQLQEGTAPGEKPPSDSLVPAIAGRVELLCPRFCAVVQSLPGTGSCAWEHVSCRTAPYPVSTQIWLLFCLHSPRKGHGFLSAFLCWLGSFTEIKEGNDTDRQSEKR